ncbi:MAG TPA: hypothetical protein VFX87_06960 [Methylomirabilota bacterium]|nr:hypothetical protein [Methylomirabilota bacterium]
MILEPAVYSGLVVVLAYWVRGMAGFGSGLIAVPLLSLMWPVTLVVPIVVALDYLGSASQGIKSADQVAWGERPRATAVSWAAWSARCSGRAGPST